MLRRLRLSITVVVPVVISVASLVGLAIGIPGVTRPMADGGARTTGATLLAAPPPLRSAVVRRSAADLTESAGSTPNIGGDPPLLPDACAACLQRLHLRLTDRSSPVEARNNLVRAILESGTLPHLHVLLDAIVDAHRADDTQLRDDLLSMVADVRSLDAAVTLLLVATDPDLGVDYPALPVELRHVIEKTLRDMPDVDDVGRLIAVRYREAGHDPDAVETLDRIAHPAALAIRAEEALAAGDIELLDKTVALLARQHHEGTPTYISALVDREILTFDEGIALATAWASDHLALVDASLGIFGGAITDPQLSPAARAVNIAMLAASSDVDGAARILDKAMRNEPDTELQGRLHDALLHLRGSGNDPTP